MLSNSSFLSSQQKLSSSSHQDPPEGLVRRSGARTHAASRESASPPLILIIGNKTQQEQNQGVTSDNHLERIRRYSAAKLQAVEITDYIEDISKINTTTENKLYLPKIVEKLKGCANFLEFRRYYDWIDGLRNYDAIPKLYNIITCKKHLLCPICSILRENRVQTKLLPRVRQALSDNPKLRPYLLTLTVRNDENLLSAYDNLTGSLRELVKRRRLASTVARYRVQTAFSKIFGGVYSIETKRGKNSRLWHPHGHMLVLCNPDDLPFCLSTRAMTGLGLWSNPGNMPESLTREWWELSGGLSIDFKPVRNPDNDDDLLLSIMEVIKYSLKYNDLSAKDILHVYDTLRGKRLIGAFGVLHGIKLPEAGPDDDAIQDRDYLQMKYNFHRQRGYLIKQIFDKQTGELLRSKDIKQEYPLENVGKKRKKAKKRP